MAVTVLEPMNGKGGAAVDGESPHGPAIIWLLAFNPFHCRHLKVFCTSCLSAFVAADGQWSLSTAFLASIAFFLALKMVFYSSAFVPPGVMNRYNPLPSKSFCTFSAGFAARMRVGQGHGVILLTLLPSIREQVEPDSIAHYGYMFSLQRLEYQRIPSSPQQAFPEICNII